jgi:hypothetical protein
MLFSARLVLRFLLPNARPHTQRDFNKKIYVWITAKSNLKNADLTPNVSFFEATIWSFHGRANVNPSYYFL